MIALPLRITLQEPLLATSLEGDPNSATSYPFIPGSLIRGALATWYWKTRQLADLAVDETARRLFLAGTTRFLNAYPLDREGHRTLPVPLSWMKEKGSKPPARIYDWSLGRENTDLEQPKTLNNPFCRLADGVVELCTPLRRFNVHTQRDRKMGRATGKSGAVFRYESLAPGQIFGAVILFDHETDVGLLHPLLADGTMLLGGSHGAGYGLVAVEAEEPQSNWREINRPLADIPAGETFILTLLSDALVRNENGQYTTTLTQEMLAYWLDVRSVKIHDIFKRSGVIGGFNRKWGLPLPQTSVIRAGSVFVLKSDKPVTAAAITSLESHGIGYRRTEGFGRVVINWHSEEELWLQKIEPEAQIEQPRLLAGESLALAQQMARRLLQRKVDGKLTDYINDLRFQPRGIRPSQLARLRVIARSAQRDNDTERVLDWLRDFQPTARKQFESARVRGDRLLDWLNARLTNPPSVWTQISLQQDSLSAIGQERAELTEELAREVTLRLIDGVLARAIKEVKDND